MPPGNVLIAGFTLEPHVAVSKGGAASPRLSVAGYHDYGANREKCSYSFAPDFGAAWAASKKVLGVADAYAVCGDPVLAIGQAGSFYAGVAFNRNPGSTVCSFGSAIFIARRLHSASLDFDPAVEVTSESSLSLFVDKPWLAASGISNDVYVTWTHVSSSCTQSHIRIARIPDGAAPGGIAVSAPLQVSITGSGAQNPQGSQVAVDRTGRVNIAWYRNSLIEFRQCDAQLSSCGATRNVANVTPVSSIGTAAVRERADSFPRLALDAGPSGTNRIYIVYASRNAAGFSNILFTSATNGPSGAGSFSSPVAIVAGNTDSFMPTIAADEQHRLHVTYYSVLGTDYNVFYTMSSDGGQTWTLPMTLSGVSAPLPTIFPLGGNTYFMGDYAGTDGFSGVLSVWSDSSADASILDTYAAQLDCGAADSDADERPDLCDVCPQNPVQCVGDCAWRSCQ
jgi:hypothetical protein